MAALGLAILYHAALGVALAGLVWVLGAGWLVLLRGYERVHAYPLGLLTVLLAAALVLVSPWLTLLAVPLVLVPLGLAWRSRALLTPAARLVAWALPPIGGLAVSLGYFLHGPSRTLDSNSFGDVVWYVAKVASAKRSLFPLHDLEVAGFHLWHAELGPTLIGGVLTKAPGVDPFLFQTSLLPAFLLASLGCGLALVRPVLVPAQRLALALLAVAMVAYPSWFAESPPVALALPLAFSIFTVVWTSPPTRRLALVGGVVALDLLLTKGLVLVPFAILLAPALASEVRTRSRALAALGLAALAALLLVFSVRNSFWALGQTRVRFTPLDALRGLHSQLTTRSTSRLSPALEVTGWVLVAAALWRMRAWRLLVALAVVLAWDWLLATPYSIRIGLGVIALLSLLLFTQRPAPRAFPFLAAAGVCLSLAVWFRDFGGLREALIATVCLGATLLSLLRPPGERALTFHVGLYAVVGSAALLALSGHAVIALIALAGAAAAWIVRPLGSLALAGAMAVVALVFAFAGSLRLGTYDTTLTTSDYDIWHQVSRRVPEGALVFTDMTRKFDYYPAIAGRQLYLAGWYQTRLRTDRNELERRLRLNEALLAGRRPPIRAGSYAVVDRSQPRPGGFTLLYANERFALYRTP